MKELIAIVGLLMVSPALAGSDVIAKYEFAQFIRDDERGYNHVSVRLNDDGVLRVEARYSRPSIWNDMRWGYTKPLAPKVFEEIKYKIILLSNADILHTNQLAVCEIYVRPGMGVDYLSVLRGYERGLQTFTGKMQMVDGPHGCWVGRDTRPKNDDFDNTAHALKEVLRVLGLQTLYEERDLTLE